VAMYTLPKPAGCSDPSPYVTQVFNIRVAEWESLPECVGLCDPSIFFIIIVVVVDGLLLLVISLLLLR
jgi:hypothetical protein